MIKTVIEIIEKSNLNLTSNNVSNVYLVGSFLFNSSHKESDYDLAVVVTGTYFDGRKTILEGLYNINIYHLEYFTYMIEQQCVDALMVLWVPEKFVLLENVKLSGIYKPNILKIKNQFVHEASTNWNKARKNFDKEKKRSIKYIIHCFRKCIFADQIIQKGKIYDYEVGNKYHKELITEDNKIIFDKDWKFYEEKYKYEFHILVHKVLDFEIKIPKEIGIENIKKYINEYGLDSLTKYFSIKVKKEDGLIFTKIDNDSPNHDFVNQFHLLVLDENNDYNCIYAYPNFHSNKTLLSKKFKTYQDPSGIDIGLYFHNNECKTIYNDNIVYLECFTEFSFWSRYLRSYLCSFDIEKEFWRIWKEKKYELPSDTSIYYTFNLICNDSSSIIQHKDENIILIDTSKNMKPILCDFKDYSIPIELNNGYKIDQLDPLESKGLIIIDEFGKKIKKVSITFEMLNQLKNFQLYDYNSNYKCIIELLRYSFNENYLKNIHFQSKEFINLYSTIKEEWNNFIKDLEIYYQLVKCDEYTEFALKSKNYPFSFALFEIRKFKGNVQQFLKDISILKLLKTIKVIKDYKYLSKIKIL